MNSENQKSAVAFPSRHFVALACEYESLNVDGSVYCRGTSVYSGFLMKLHGRIFWTTAGHCLKDELDENIDKGVLRITGAGFLDYFAHEATHDHMVQRSKQWTLYHYLVNGVGSAGEWPCTRLQRRPNVGTRLTP